MNPHELLARTLTTAGLSILLTTGCSPGGDDPFVTVYTSQDQVYSEPILREFESRTGLRVRVVYDSEAVKTVGLVNRLILEKDHPRCDLFWNNEELRTRQLQARGVLRAEDPFRVFGVRARQWVINTNFLQASDIPVRLSALTNAQWRGRSVLSMPLFGTTATHFLALRQEWGEEDWKQWCRALIRNEVKFVDGNSLVVKMVGRGEAAIGLTDSDDVRAGLRRGLPIQGLSLRDDGLAIRNTVGFIGNSPNPTGAEQLAEYLQSGGVLGKLREAGALDPASPVPGSEALDWEELLDSHAAATVFLKDVFLRN